MENRNAPREEEKNKYTTPWDKITEQYNREYCHKERAAEEDPARLYMREDRWN